MSSKAYLISNMLQPAANVRHTGMDAGATNREANPVTAMSSYDWQRARC